MKCKNKKAVSRLHSGRTFGLHEPSAWQYLKDNQDHRDDTDNDIDDDDNYDDGDDCDHNDNDNNLSAVCLAVSKR